MISLFQTSTMHLAFRNQWIYCFCTINLLTHMLSKLWRVASSKLPHCFYLSFCVSRLTSLSHLTSSLSKQPAETMQRCCTWGAWPPQGRPRLLGDRQRAVDDRVLMVCRTASSVPWDWPRRPERTGLANRSGCNAAGWNRSSSSSPEGAKGAALHLQEECRPPLAPPSHDARL